MRLIVLSFSSSLMCLGSKTEEERNIKLIRLGTRDVDGLKNTL